MENENLIKLKAAVLEKRKINLTKTQEDKFNDACAKAIEENKDADFDMLFEAANIYLNYIIRNYDQL